MNDRINLSYFAYGNRDFPFLKKESKLPEPSVCVKTSGANIMQRNYLSFEPGSLLSSVNNYRPRKFNKMSYSRSTQNINVVDKIFNKYHPEYKRYKSTNEQIIDLNNYLNPVKQYIYRDDPKTRNSDCYIAYKKKKIFFPKEADDNESNETSKDKIILKDYKNNNILIPNNYKMKNFNSLPNISNDRNKEQKLNIQNLRYGTFCESRETPEYLRNYDVEALKNIDNYYIKRNENIHILSRFGNWITLKPDDKNRSHALEKIKRGNNETSIVAPEWMDIASRRKINQKYEMPKKLFKSYQAKINTRDNTRVTLLIDRDQGNAKPLFLRDSYEKYRILLNSKNE